MRVLNYAQRSVPIGDIVSRHVNRLDERSRNLALHLADAEAAALDAEPRHVRAWVAEDQEGACVGVLLASEKQWEAAHFRCRFEQLSLFRTTATCEPVDSISESLVSAWLVESRPLGGYATIRVNSRDVDIARSLETHGFRTLAPTVTLMRRAPQRREENRRPPPHGFTIGECTPDDVEQVTTIARDAFIYGRFWNEPRLSREIAREMHAEWALNCCRKHQADEVFVAKRGGEVLGFNAVRVRTYRGVAFGEINLIAVDQRARAEGVGRVLVNAGNRWLESRASELMVRTESPNVAAIRLYERCGFLTVDGALYLGMFLS